MTTSISREQFLQALRDHPDWREEIRAQILGEELMRLPLAFQAFVVKQEKFNDEMREFRDNQLEFNDEMREFRDNQLEFNDEMREFRDNQLEFNDEMREFRAETLRRFGLIDHRFELIDHRFNNIDRRFDRLEGDTSWLKNASTEAMATSGAFAICLAADCEMNRILDRNDVMAMARELTGTNITPGDRASFARADLVVEATDAAGATVYLAVEVSYTAAQRDRDRAQRNAEYLARHTGSRAVPVVAGVRYDRELQGAIDAGELIWFEIDEP